MFKCKKCNSIKIRSRTNYSHGKKSKSTMSFTCKDCGSNDIDSSQNDSRQGNRGSKRGPSRK